MRHQSEVKQELKAWMRRLAVWVAGLTGLLIMAGSGAVWGQPAVKAPDLLIRVKPEVWIEKAAIELQHIAGFSGAPADGSPLKSLSLGLAPRPGKAKVLVGSWVASMIEAHAPAGLSLKIDSPDYVTVKRRFQTPSEEQLREELENYVRRCIPDGEYRLSRFKVRGRKALPTGSLMLKPLRIPKKDLAGQVILPLAVRVDSQSCGRITLYGWVDRFRPVVCAERAMPRHHILTADDVGLALMNVSRSSSSAAGSIEDVVGQRLKRSVRTGTPIKRHMLDHPPLIQKGDRVRLIARKGALTVATLGIAKTQGGRGEQIKVENVSSKKLVVGRVSDPSTVQVVF